MIDTAARPTQLHNPRGKLRWDSATRFGRRAFFTLSFGSSVGEGRSDLGAVHDAPPDGDRHKRSDVVTAGSHGGLERLAARPQPVGEALYDATIVFVAGLLMALGVAMVYSASLTVRMPAFQLRQWWDTPLRQAGFALAGFLGMLIAAHVDYRVFAWRRPGDWWRSGLLYTLAVVLLVAVFVPGVGRAALGARRAITIPGLELGFQPGELAKLALVVWLAAYLTAPSALPGARRSSLVGRSGVGVLTIRDFTRGFAPAVVGGGLLVALTGIEDFGTAALLGMVMLLMLWQGGARVRHLGLLGLVAALGGVGLILLKRHRLERILTWWTKDPDPSGPAYQVNQALMAIGSGGWWGRGLGAGVQKYGYLPQDNNDFILAIICEELGVVGGLVVVGLFLLLLWRGACIARRCPDPFGRLLASGLTLVICLQAAMNVGVVTNSIPTKGISLPFVSAGGSGVVFLGLAAGLLAAVARTLPSAECRPAAGSPDG